MSRNAIYSDLSSIEKMLRYTVGQDPNVYIEKMQYKGECMYEIKIKVRGQGRGESLRAILPRSYEYGQNTIVTKICREGEEEIWSCIPQKNARQVATLFCMALETNPYFMGAMLPEEKWLNISTNVTIWIWKDEVYLTPCSGPQTLSELFAQVLKRDYGCLMTSHVWFRDYRKGCVKPCQMYCGYKEY